MKVQLFQIQYLLMELEGKLIVKSDDVSQKIKTK